MFLWQTCKSNEKKIYMSDFRAGCVQLWMHSPESPGEQCYENWNNGNIYKAIEIFPDSRHHTNLGKHTEFSPEKEILQYNVLIADSRTACPVQRIYFILGKYNTIWKLIYKSTHPCTSCSTEAPLLDNPF